MRVTTVEKAKPTLFPFSGLRLLPPAIIPSWRFFDAVTASPRLDYALLGAADEEARIWQEFRPRPARLTFSTMVRRLFWNPDWSEALFLVSLSERLITTTSSLTETHSERELLLRVARHLDRQGIGDHEPYLQIRLRFVRRKGADEHVESETVYLSRPCARAELATR
jgi:hypothetical protein